MGATPTWPFFAAVLVALASPACAQVTYDEPLDLASASLHPGAFLWRDDPSLDEPVTLSISLIAQRLFVYRGDVLIGVAAISSGRPGHSTPLGDFRILQKARWHRSNLYSNAPMPFMQRLTWGGVALHAGINPGYPASHGCIRLPFAFARTLFGLTELGGAVAVTDYPAAVPIYLRIEWAALDGDADAMIGSGPAMLDYAASVFLS